jgi:hypothetical protein
VRNQRGKKGQRGNGVRDTNTNKQRKGNEQKEKEKERERDWYIIW